MTQLTTEQQQAVTHVAETDDLVLVSAVAGSGKEQPLSAPILTPDGWTTMGQINEGDLVLGSSGPTKVLGVYPQGVKAVYKVTFIDGTTVMCGHDHLWTVHSRESPGGTTVLSVKDMLATALTVLMYDEAHSFYAPSYTYSIDPLGPCEFGTDVVASMTPYELGLHLRDRDEVIPSEYLSSSLQSRKDLYEGLTGCSSSGTDKGDKCCVTSSKLAAESILELSRSLGNVCVLRETWEGSTAVYAVLHKPHAPKAIVSIELSHEEVSQCIRVAAKDSLYVTSGYNLTHNTTLLVAMAEAVPHTNGLYLAYNKAIATSAANKFPSSTYCVTTHSLAYRAVVKQYGLRVGFFSYRDIKEPLAYEGKTIVVDEVRNFCLSGFLTYQDYVGAQPEDKAKALSFAIPIVTKYLGWMADGTIECTHDFYLKMFHLLLVAEEVTYDKDFEFIMLDEAGDLNEVTLEIFRSLPSKKKIAVGDPFQNIYMFNNTINCFAVLEKEPGSKTFYMSQSFRTSDTIAPKIEAFCQQYLNPDMVLKGVPITDPTIATRAYITRTNGALIAKMVELDTANIPYSLVRKARQIFKLPLLLCGLKNNGFIGDRAYSHIQEDVDEWYATPTIQAIHSNPYTYLISQHADDIPLVQACKAVLRFGKGTIIETSKEAKRHENTNQNFTLATSHSVKGLEFDEVTLAEDINVSTAPAIAQAMTQGIDTLDELGKESLNLYYVACTRAIKILNNAVHLNTDPAYFGEKYPSLLNPT